MNIAPMIAMHTVLSAARRQQEEHHRRMMRQQQEAAARRRREAAKKKARYESELEEISKNENSKDSSPLIDTD